MSQVFHSNDLYLMQRCWYAEVSALKFEVESSLTSLFDILEDDTLLSKPGNILFNLLVGTNMRFDKLLIELDNSKEVLSKYPSTFPISSCNRSYKKHFQLENKFEAEKLRYIEIRKKVDLFFANCNGILLNNPKVYQSTFNDRP
ncbi:MAG: hypothetical protein CMO01_11455 [Thalassobius sp.]|nr:hypothetical protein [Thalassovita sp.]